MTNRKFKSTPQRSSRVTISDVSAALGLTKGTVSRALNGYPDISERTRLKVHRMAQTMGYQPLSAAQGLRTGRSRALGLIIQSFDHDGQRPFLAEFLAGISGTAAREDWTLTVTSSDTEDDMLNVMQRLIRDRKADGFILPRSRVADPRIALLRQMGVPFVLFGRTEDPEGCAWFDVKGGEAMRKAVLRLRDLGHSQIGYVGGGKQYYYTRLRHEGFLKGMADAGLTVKKHWLTEGAVSRREGEHATERLLSQAVRPTAIVFAVDAAALGAWDAAPRFGVKIGQGLSVVSYDGSPEGAAMTPALASYAVDVRHAGARLTDLLIRRIRGEPVEALREEEEAVFRPGGSLAPCPVTAQ